MGREVWGEKWESVLVGGSEESKLDVVFFIRVHESMFSAVREIPGRDVIRVIPPEAGLVEQDGHHWLPKDKIAKILILKEGVSEIEPVGLTMAEGDPWVKLFFGYGAVSLVFLQLAALSAILVDIFSPGCSTQDDCDGRLGMYCDSVPGGSGRCEYCGDIGRFAGLVVIDEALAVNETSFTQRFSSTRLNALNFSSAADFCADPSHARLEYCDGEVFLGGEASCRHPACGGCLKHEELPGVDEYCNSPAGRERFKKDGAASICGWGHSGGNGAIFDSLRNTALYQIIALVVAMVMVVLPLSDQVVNIKACFVALDQFGDDGEEAVQALLTVLACLRLFVIVPFIAMIVPCAALQIGMRADVIFVYAVIALFVLRFETELYQFGLPDAMRAQVELFGRVRVSEAQMKLDAGSKKIVWGGFLATTAGPVLIGVWITAKAMEHPADYTGKNNAGFVFDLLIPLCNVCCLVVATIPFNQFPADPNEERGAGRAVRWVFKLVVKFADGLLFYATLVTNTAALSPRAWKACDENLNEDIQFRISCDQVSTLKLFIVWSTVFVARWGIIWWGRRTKVEVA
eukprot:COSAG02_NODE_7372_length_3058_cov_1.996604_2_plen_573_part_00